MEARIKFSYGRTINLGNYESARVDIGIEENILPGHTREGTLQEIEEFVLKQVKGWVDQHGFSNPRK